MKNIGIITVIISLMIQTILFVRYYDFTAYEKYLSTAKILHTPTESNAFAAVCSISVLIILSSIGFGIVAHEKFGGGSKY